jgi:hypothetical protein
MKPVLGPGISGRVHAALETTDEQVEYCLKARSEMRAALSNLLKNDGILVIPTAPAPPKLRSKGRQLEDFLSSNAIPLIRSILDVSFERLQTLQNKDDRRQEILQILCSWLRIRSTFPVKFSSKKTIFSIADPVFRI